MAQPRIGFLGPAPLTNGYTAAGRFLTHLTGAQDPWSEVSPLALPSHPDVLRALTTGAVDYGVIAVENTLDGIIIESIRELERLFEAGPEVRPWICWEELLSIRHLFINQTGRLTDIARIATHPSAQRQCSRFLDALQKMLGTKIEVTPVKSTGDGARLAAENPTVATLASQEALDHFDGRLREIELTESIASTELSWEDPTCLTDFRNGLTRFWVLSRQTMPMVPHSRVTIPVQHEGKLLRTEDHQLQKTCFLFNLPDQPGFMHRALGAFASREINVAVIYPYPRLERAFEYLYFVEIEGHGDDPMVVEAQQQINAGLTHLPLNQRACIRLGSYPNTPFLHRHPQHRAAFLSQASSLLRSVHTAGAEPAIPRVDTSVM